MAEERINTIQVLEKIHSIYLKPQFLLYIHCSVK